MYFSFCILYFLTMLLQQLGCGAGLQADPVSRLSQDGTVSPPSCCSLYLTSLMQAAEGEGAGGGGGETSVLRQTLNLLYLQAYQ